MYGFVFLLSQITLKRGSVSFTQKR